MNQTGIQFRYRQMARNAVRDKVLRGALFGIQERFGKGTARAYRNLPEGPGLRQVAHAIRTEAVENLDLLLARLADKIEERKGRVYFADSAADAVAYCREVARRHGVKSVVKGKSMVTEEIGLNRALEADGIEVSETDLGEFIVQLAGEHPSHIIAPAIHKTKEQIGRLFVERLGVPYTDDPPTLTMAARKALRKKFLSADMGISGCNIACAETGHITTVSNEGNIRMSTTLPRVHMAFMGMERIVGRLADHDVLFRLLARGAAAQDMAGYVSYIGGPRPHGQADGPDAFYLVILDNGRSRILADPRFREILCCIRCAACLNVCPVYGEIGGHAYGFAYSGPVGAVITPLLTGVNRARDLCQGETLCGACRQACPVDIDIPRLLLELRAMLAEGDARWGVKADAPLEEAAFRLWSVLIRHPRLYELAVRGAAAAGRLLPRSGAMIRRLPPPLSGWTASRDLRLLSGKSFVRRK